MTVNNSNIHSLDFKSISGIDILHNSFFKESIIPSWRCITKYFAGHALSEIERQMITEYIELASFHQYNMARVDKIDLDGLRKKYHLPENVTCWFISEDEVHFALKEIRDCGIVIDSQIYTYLWAHVTFNFNASLIRHLETKYGETQDLLRFNYEYEEINNFLKRLKYIENKPDKDFKRESDNQILDYLIVLRDSFCPDLNGKEFLKVISQLVTGKSKKVIFNHMVTSCFNLEKNTVITRYKFLVTTYSFFKLILQDFPMDKDRNKDKAHQLSKILPKGFWQKIGPKQPL